jgi:hypothetical protein
VLVGEGRVSFRDGELPSPRGGGRLAERFEIALERRNRITVQKMTKDSHLDLSGGPYPIADFGESLDTIAYLVF